MRKTGSLLSLVLSLVLTGAVMAGTGCDRVGDKLKPMSNIPMIPVPASTQPLRQTTITGIYPFGEPERVLLSKQIFDEGRQGNRETMEIYDPGNGRNTLIYSDGSAGYGVELDRNTGQLYLINLTDSDYTGAGPRRVNLDTARVDLLDFIARDARQLAKSDLEFGPRPIRIRSQDERQEVRNKLRELVVQGQLKGVLKPNSSDRFVIPDSGYVGNSREFIFATRSGIYHAKLNDGGYDIQEAVGFGSNRLTNEKTLWPVFGMGREKIYYALPSNPGALMETSLGGKK